MKGGERGESTGETVGLQRKGKYNTLQNKIVKGNYTQHIHCVCLHNVIQCHI